MHAFYFVLALAACGGGRQSAARANPDAQVANDAAVTSEPAIDAGMSVHDAGRDLHDASSNNQADAAAADAGKGLVDAAQSPSNQPALAISPTGIDIGTVTCGTQLDPYTLQLTNLLDDPVPYSASLSGRDAARFAIVDGTGGELAVGATSRVRVTLSTSLTALAAGAALQASLDVITANPGSLPLRVPLTAVLSGAALTLSSETLQFGEVPVQHMLALPVSLTNHGDVAAGLTFHTPADAQFTLLDAPQGQIQLAPTDSITVHVQFVPNVSRKTTSSLTIDVEGAQCGAPLGLLEVAGIGTAGSAVVADHLDFGAVDCGSQAAPMQLSIGNAGSAAFKFVAALGLDSDHSPYELGTTIGEVEAGGTIDLSVAPKGISSFSSIPGNYSDELTITTDVLGDVPHVVALHESARGAVLATDAQQLSWGPVTVGIQQTRGFHVMNSGILPVHVSLELAAGSSPDFTATPSTPTLLAANASLDATVWFKPSRVGSQMGSLTLRVDDADVVCEELPTALSLTGSGQ